MSIDCRIVCHAQRWAMVITYHSVKLTESQALLKAMALEVTDFFNIPLVPSKPPGSM